MSPALMAKRTSAASDFDPVFFMIDARWFSTVRMLIWRSAAMFLLGNPSRINCRTSRSRGVKAGNSSASGSRRSGALNPTDPGSERTREASSDRYTTIITGGHADTPAVEGINTSSTRISRPPSKRDAANSESIVRAPFLRSRPLPRLSMKSPSVVSVATSPYSARALNTCPGIPPSFAASQSPVARELFKPCSSQTTTTQSPPRSALITRSANPCRSA